MNQDNNIKEEVNSLVNGEEVEGELSKAEKRALRKEAKAEAKALKKYEKAKKRASKGEDEAQESGERLEELFSIDPVEEEKQLSNNEAVEDASENDKIALEKETDYVKPLEDEIKEVSLEQLAKEDDEDLEENGEEALEPALSKKEFRKKEKQERKWAKLSKRAEKEQQEDFFTEDQAEEVEVEKAQENEVEEIIESEVEPTLTKKEIKKIERQERKAAKANKKAQKQSENNPIEQTQDIELTDDEELSLDVEESNQNNTVAQEAEEQSAAQGEEAAVSEKDDVNEEVVIKDISEIELSLSNDKESLMHDVEAIEDVIVEDKPVEELSKKELKRIKRLEEKARKAEKEFLESYDDNEVMVETIKAGKKKNEKGEEQSDIEKEPTKRALKKLAKKQKQQEKKQRIEEQAKQDALEKLKEEDIDVQELEKDVQQAYQASEVQEAEKIDIAPEEKLQEEIDTFKKIPLAKNKLYKPDQFARFEIYKDAKEDFRFRIVAENGEIVAYSQGFKSKAGCKTIILAVIKNSTADIIDSTVKDCIAKIGEEVFEVYKSTDNKYRFRLRASDAKLILTSQGYSVKASCIKAITSVKNVCEAETILDLS